MRVLPASQMNALAEWSKQFAHDSASVFVEIGSDEFSQRVLPAHELVAALHDGDVEGIRYYSSYEEIMDLTGVACIRLAPGHGAALYEVSDLVDGNDYPPILFSDSAVAELCEKWGYKVHPVRSDCEYPVYLASDNLVYTASCEARRPRWARLLERAVAAGEAKQAYEALSLCDEKSEYHAHLAIARITKSVQAYEEVIFSPHSPWEIKNKAIQEQGHLLRPLCATASHSYAPDWLPEHFVGSSASFTDKGMILRAVNYSICNGDYVAMGSDHIETRNFLCEEKQGELEPVCEIEADYGAVADARVRGMEDIRAFGQDRFFCVCADANPEQVPQVCCGRVGSKELVRLSMGDRPGPPRCEKNWLPFMDGDDARFIYKMKPFTVCALADDGAVSVLSRRSHDQDLSVMRGSAAPVPYRGGWLFTVHQVHYSKLREYYHRFAWMSASYGGLKLSTPFFFEGWGVEYNIGLQVDEERGIARLAYSTFDNSTTVAHVPLAKVEALFA